MSQRSTKRIIRITSYNVCYTKLLRNRETQARIHPHRLFHRRQGPILREMNVVPGAVVAAVDHDQNHFARFRPRFQLDDRQMPTSGQVGDAQVEALASSPPNHSRWRGEGSSCMNDRGADLAP